MTFLSNFKSWLSDPFDRKKNSQKHTDIQRDIQLLRGQVEQKKRELSRHPYRTLHKEFRQEGRGTDVPIYE